MGGTLTSIGALRGRGEATATWLGTRTALARTEVRGLVHDRRPSGDAAKPRSRDRAARTAMSRTEVRGPVHEGEPTARSALNGDAAKQRKCGLATRTPVARTEVRGPANGGETFTSIGAYRGRSKAAATWPGIKTNDGSYESQKTRTRGRSPHLDRRLSGARRSSGHVAGQQKQRWRTEVRGLLH